MDTYKIRFNRFKKKSFALLCLILHDSIYLLKQLKFQKLFEKCIKEVYSKMALEKYLIGHSDFIISLIKPLPIMSCNKIKS